MRFIFLLSLALVQLTASSMPPSNPPNARSNGAWILVFNDEFNATTLDRTRWHTMFPWGRDRSSVGELQWYADDAFEVANGILRIKAEQRSINGYDYTSGMIASWGHFAPTYGYFEIRSKIPCGKALWPAFWLAPASTDWPPEIDIFESRGDETDTVTMTNHWIGPDGEPEHYTTDYTGPDFAEDFHTFGAAWTPAGIVWYIDGVERAHSTKGIPSEPMYVIANLAIGSEEIGYPDETTPFPSYFEIDYIRVYRWTPVLHVRYTPLISRDPAPYPYPAQ